MSKLLLFFPIFIVPLIFLPVFCLCYFSVPYSSLSRTESDLLLKASKNYEHELIKMLVTRTNRLTKPATRINCSLIVKARLYLIRIQHIDEATETLVSTIRLQLNWQDPGLSWRPSEYGGLKDVVIPGGKLWIPDLQIANSVDFAEDFLSDKGKFAFRVTSAGSVWYHPTGSAKTRCKFDLIFYPFDMQCCLIIVESVIYQEGELKLITRTDDQPTAVSFGMLAENEVWEIVGDRVGGVSTNFRSGKRTVFSRIHFWMVMRRKPAFFVVTVIIPTFILAVITLLTYLVPIHYVDRPVQSVTTVLTVAIFEVMVAEKLPNNSANCLLTIYLTVILCTSAITIFTTTVCVAIVDPGLYISTPWGLPEASQAIWNLFNCKLKICKRICKRSKKAATTANKKDQLIRNKLRRISRAPDMYECWPANRQHNNNISFKSPATASKHSHSSHHHNNNRFALVLSSKQRRNKNYSPPSVQKGSIYEPNTARTLTTSRKAWYVAYAINWIGFTICLIPTLILPVVAYFYLPSDIPHDFVFQTQRDINDTSPFASLYYGE